MRNRRRFGVILGLIIALAIPVLSFVVAFLWDRGVLALAPNGPFVQALQSIAVWELVLGPVGIVVAGRSAGLRGVAAWLATVLLAVPVLAYLWFVGVAYLGGLAGEPF